MIMETIILLHYVGQKAYYVVLVSNIIIVRIIIL